MRKNPTFPLLAVSSVLWLAGCQTASVEWPNPFKTASTTSAPADAAAPETTGSVPGGSTVVTAPNAASASAPVFQSDVMPPKKALMGADPYDDLSIGKRAYASGNYGLAEQHFRRATEQTNNDAEAWLGLAASYDRLKRFDLADRAYKNLLRLTGPTPEVLNNIGYSLILRGDYANARLKLAEAQAMDPNNAYVRANIEVLDRMVTQRKGVR